MSGRNLDRYLNVLRTPREVQQAFERGKLPLAQVARVAHLDAAEQAKIAEELKAGDDPKSVLTSHLKTANEKKQKPSSMMSLRDFKKALADLKEHSSQERYIRPEDVPVLEAAKVCINELLEKRLEADKLGAEALLDAFAKIDAINSGYSADTLAATENVQPEARVHAEANTSEVGEAFDLKLGNRTSIDPIGK